MKGCDFPGPLKKHRLKELHKCLNDKACRLRIGDVAELEARVKINVYQLESVRL